MRKKLTIDDIATTIVLAKEQGAIVWREDEIVYFADPKQFYMKPEPKKEQTK